MDLRRPRCSANFRLRHDITLAIRDNLSQQGFLEIETPILTKSTPEGARDFLVPSRVHPGEFYALPQSPQIFKQILMCSGFDKYFQIARCFRDEDLRADRQLEFTQVDIEMSFPHQETVFAVAEKFMVAGFAAAGVTLPTPFPRITYDDSLRQYGSDKPDMRLPGLTDVRSAFTDEDLGKLLIDPALPVVALRIPKVGELSRKEREDNHLQFDLKKGAKFIDDFKRLAKGFPEAAAKVRELAAAAEGDFVIVVAGDPAHPVKASDTKFPGQLSERGDQRLFRAGNFRTELAKSTPTGTERLPRPRDGARRRGTRGWRDGGWSSGLPADLDCRLPDVRVRPGDRGLGAGAPSLHRAARGGYGQPADRPGQCAGQLLRPGDERPGAWFGLLRIHRYGRATADFSVAWH